jgi:hypothetical protein
VYARRTELAGADETATLAATRGLPAVDRSHEDELHGIGRAADFAAVAGDFVEVPLVRDAAEEARDGLVLYLDGLRGSELVEVCRLMLWVDGVCFTPTPRGWFCWFVSSRHHGREDGTRAVLRAKNIYFFAAVVRMPPL